MRSGPAAFPVAAPAFLGPGGTTLWVRGFWCCRLLASALCARRHRPLDQPASIALPALPTAPVYGAGGELVFSGQDLSIGGALEYFHDVLYICLFVQVAPCAAPAASCALHSCSSCVLHSCVFVQVRGCASRSKLPLPWPAVSVPASLTSSAGALLACTRLLRWRRLPASSLPCWQCAGRPAGALQSIALATVPQALGCYTDKAWWTFLLVGAPAEHAVSLLAVGPQELVSHSSAIQAVQKPPTGKAVQQPSTRNRQAAADVCFLSGPGKRGGTLPWPPTWPCPPGNLTQARGAWGLSATSRDRNALLSLSPPRSHRSPPLRATS